MNLKNTLLLLLMVISTVTVSAQILSDKQVDSLMRESKKYLKPGDKKPSDPAKFFSLMTQCANAGNAMAMYSLGECYLKGIGTSASEATAAIWYEKAGEKNFAYAYYRLGMVCKRGVDGAVPDFDRAYQNFCKAADRDVTNGIFMKGYMLYTGLGCRQDYEAAYPLSQKAAARKNGDAMRFLGLCMSNGYGTKRNMDSARYWFRKSDSYSRIKYDSLYHAFKPTVRPAPGLPLVERVKAAQALVKDGNPVNTYTRIYHSVAAGEIEGTYEGWLLKYDWSGKHIIKADKIKVELRYENDSLKGRWTENDTVSLAVRALLTKNALLFNGMEYIRKNRFSKVFPELVRFENARLQMVKDKDSAYLCGDLQMYSVSRKEPAKPMYIALVRTARGSSNKTIPYVNEDGSTLSTKKINAYPNPFRDVINLDFELTGNSTVQVKMFSLDGKLVYSNAVQTLSAGVYNIPVQPQQLVGGTYVLQLITGKKINTIKVVKAN